VNDPLLKAREVADLLGVEMGTVVDWALDGKLPFVRLGGTPRGRLRFRRSDVEEAIQRWTRAPDTLSDDIQGPASTSDPGRGNGKVGSDARRSIRPARHG
jgi:excisionase family DNA binding protein